MFIFGICVWLYCLLHDLYARIPRHWSKTGRSKEGYQDRHGMRQKKQLSGRKLIQKWDCRDWCSVSSFWFQRFKHGSSLSYIDKTWWYLYNQKKQLLICKLMQRRERNKSSQVQQRHFTVSSGCCHGSLEKCVSMDSCQPRKHLCSKNGNYISIVIWIVFLMSNSPKLCTLLHHDNLHSDGDAWSKWFGLMPPKKASCSRGCSLQFCSVGNVGRHTSEVCCRCCFDQFRPRGKEVPKTPQT